MRHIYASMERLCWWPLWLTFLIEHSESFYESCSHCQNSTCILAHFTPIWVKEVSSFGMRLTHLSILPGFEPVRELTLVGSYPPSLYHCSNGPNKESFIPILMPEQPHFHLALINIQGLSYFGVGLNPLTCVYGWPGLHTII